jgi:hypothetical protein
MGRAELYQRLGPDLEAMEHLSEVDRPQLVAISPGPGPQLGVWGLEASSPRLGRFGRLRALAAAVGGKPLALDYRWRPFLKLVTYVPASHLEMVRQALGEAGAGHIGNYSHCTFAAPGEGTFFPLTGAQPFLGEVGRLERVAEWRLETIVPLWLKDRIESQLLAVHPYEEVAYDWIPLANEMKVARGREVDGEWWCDRLDAQLAAQALRYRPQAVHCEWVEPRERMLLRLHQIALIVHPPGSFLLEGMRRLWEESF